MIDDDEGDFYGYCAYDGNGNLCQVVDGSDGSIDAHYEYDPYGREILASGAYAEDSPWRFSTKYLDVVDPGDPDATLPYYGQLIQPEARTVDVQGSGGGGRGSDLP